MKNKIGVGYITCNAQDRLEESLPLIPNVDEMVIINDGSAYDASVYGDKEVIQHTKNKGVGISKNDAMRYLVQHDCDHIFIIEDDVLIKDEKVFEKYIKTAEASGIWHLNYALQGPANRVQSNQGPMYINDRQNLDQDTAANPRQIVEYTDDIKLALYPNCVGAFSYFLKSVIKHVGYHDEHFHNAWEHVEHTNRIIKAGLHPPFWWFADIAESWNYLSDIEGCIENSAIAKTEEWNRNLQEGMEWYKHKHGHYPQQTPNTSEQEVMAVLEKLETSYARKVL